MKIKSLLYLILAGFIFQSAGFTQSIAQWRGDNREGIYSGNNLIKIWPENGPSLLWSVENIGNGYSSPVAANNILYVNGEINNAGYLFAFDVKGNLLWKSPNGAEYPQSDTSSEKYSGPRSTPTVKDEVVYSCSGLGRIGCFNALTGEELWNVDMVKDFGGMMHEAGYAESLLIDGDLLYCFPGGKENNAVALNRFTGKSVWTSKVLGDSVSFSSPLMVTLPTLKVIVNFSSKYIFGLNAATGELLWSQKQENARYNQQYSTPVYAGGNIYYVSGNGNGAVKLELSADGKKIKEIWRIPNSLNGLNSPIHINDFLYFTDVRQKLKCIDINRGIVVDSLRINRGSLISADGMFFCYSETGQVSLIKSEGSKMEIVSKFKVDKGTREHLSTPAIFNGVMYIRHGNTLLAYNISKDM